MDNNAVFLLFIGIFVAGLILFAIVSSGKMVRRAPIDRDYYRGRIRSIEDILQGGNAHSLAIAVMDADKLLDSALKARGFRGQTMGERLKSAGRSFRDNNAVWSAHKLRNKIAHENDVRVDAGQAKQAIAALKDGLRDVGAL